MKVEKERKKKKDLNLVVLSRVILLPHPPRGPLAMPGNSFDGHNWW